MSVSITKIVRLARLAHVCDFDKTQVESDQARCLTQFTILTTPFQKLIQDLLPPLIGTHYTKCSYRKLTYISHTSTTTN